MPAKIGGQFVSELALTWFESAFSFSVFDASSPEEPAPDSDS
jgi:hypothetical protein